MSCRGKNYTALTNQPMKCYWTLSEMEHTVTRMPELPITCWELSTHQVRGLDVLSKSPYKTEVLYLDSAKFHQKATCPGHIDPTRVFQRFFTLRSKLVPWGGKFLTAFMDISPFFSNIEPQPVPTYISLLLYFRTCINHISPKCSNAKHYESICVCLEKVAKMEHVVNRRIWGLLVHKATLYRKPPKLWRKLSATLKKKKLIRDADQ